MEKMNIPGQPMKIRPNPLQQYFRSIKLYITLPSGTSYYGEDTIQFTDMGEVGVMPMTGRDEIILKNPDALLNGEALIDVLSSCIPAVKNPRALLTNDIDALITAIRFATYNDSLETNMQCPQCREDNVFKLDLQYSLDNMTFLEPDYVVNLETGLSVFIKPYSFPELLKGLHSQFEANKITKSIQDPLISEQQKSAIFGSAFKNLATIKFELISECIVRIVDESKNVNVKDKSFIKEFLMNIDKASIDLIDKQVEIINAIGIKKTFSAKCVKCAHEWESEIDFNPVNFL
jgi:hypothetical protein